jgi:hypothetical protein
MKKKSVFLRISGGIGNQLFQYSYGLAQAKRSGQSTQLKILAFYQNQFLFSGKKYSATRELRLVKLLGKQNDTNICNDKANFILDKLLRYRFFRNKVLRSLYLRLTGDLILDGYFQNQEEFSLSKTILTDLQELYRKNNERMNCFSSNCAIHVRAGDLLNQPWNQLCDKSYYSAAIDYMITNFKITHFDVISENEEYAKSLMPDIDGIVIKILPPGDEVSDFVSLADHPYIICANSTFSWWAAVLGGALYFCSPEYFYRPGDKPGKFDNEHCIAYLR